MLLYERIKQRYGGHVLVCIRVERSVFGDLFQTNDWVEIVNRYSNVIRHPGQNEGKAGSVCH